MYVCSFHFNVWFHLKLASHSHDSNSLNTQYLIFIAFHILQNMLKKYILTSIYNLGERKRAEIANYYKGVSSLCIWLTVIIDLHYNALQMDCFHILYSLYSSLANIPGVGSCIKTTHSPVKLVAYTNIANWILRMDYWICRMSTLLRSSWLNYN